MAEFKEEEHPRKKDGKFAPKGKDESKQDRQKELENKFNSDLPLVSKNSLSKQEWALWYKAVAENKALGYWYHPVNKKTSLLTIETKSTYKIVVTGGTFLSPKVKGVFSFRNTQEMFNNIEVIKELWKEIY